MNGDDFEEFLTEIIENLDNILNSKNKKINFSKIKNKNCEMKKKFEEKFIEKMEKISNYIDILKGFNVDK